MRLVELLSLNMVSIVDSWHLVFDLFLYPIKFGTFLTESLHFLETFLTEILKETPKEEED